MSNLFNGGILGLCSKSAGILGKRFVPRLIFTSLKRVTAVITLEIWHRVNDKAAELNRASFLLSFFSITLLEAIIGPPAADVGVFKYIWYRVDPYCITGVFTKVILQPEQRVGKNDCACCVFKSSESFALKYCATGGEIQTGTWWIYRYIFEKEIFSCFYFCWWKSSDVRAQSTSGYYWRNKN